MARPREFDPEKVMNSAMDLFWRQGYEDASLASLLQAMGLTKGSFYKAFFDKRSVYLAALDLYAETVVTDTVRLLTNGSEGTGTERIRALFASAAETGDGPQQRRGCFLCNAAVDRAPHDREVEEKVQAMIRRLEAGFASALRSSWPGWGDEDISARSVSLVTAYMGLRVMQKAGLGEAASTAVLERLDSLIGPGS
ncbi:TetR/AcrR family transcriptional regulator [Roseibium litorale]|uniref:TetR/AcrR family transcriptional regulator n=1 Tax=Roseibium litorale TaxID=2803841 RepID=A0ABR9CSZ2_9HYPH|nr:TetR/AcrR family transcriptional regulator [Roseibium litorale]MBD8893985.1 TetR/AcrR family transcriptional regulator [Roseibium litorale]